MAQPLVSDILNDSRQLLSDTEVGGGEVFTDAVLLAHFQIAFRELYDALALAGIPRSKVIATVTINSFVATPAALGLLDFESPIELRESAGIIYPVQSPPVTDGGPTLRQYCYENGTLFFLGAGPQSVRIRYFQAAPAAPTTTGVTIAVDNCQNFLIFRTAGLAAATKGMTDLATLWNAMAVGKSDGSSPGFIAGLTSAAEKARKKMQAQRPTSMKV
jgi:hypothetical protein